MLAKMSRFPFFDRRALFGFVGLIAITFGAGLENASAGDKLVQPPYLIVGSDHIIVGVVWDEVAVRKLLPPWIRPAEAMTGAINIFQAERGYGLNSYQSAYFWVDVEGFDSLSGIKGRWMLQGVYGPEEYVSASYRKFYGLPVRNGISRFEATAQGRRAIGSVGGYDFVTVEVKTGAKPCELSSVTLNYLTPEGVLEVPATGDVCDVEPLSVDVHAPAGDPFEGLLPIKVLWAIQFRNGIFSNPRPVSYSEYRGQNAK